MKKLLTSKRFWVAVLGILGTVSKVVPPDIAAYTIAAATFGTKLIDLAGE